MSFRVSCEINRRLRFVIFLLIAVGCVLDSDHALMSDENQTSFRDTVPDEAAASSVTFQSDVLPLLQQYCFACHAEGSQEGNLAFDEYPSADAMTADIQTWWSVIKNVRSDVMPPEGEDRPTESEKQLLFEWITRRVFKSDLAHFDPGPNRLRRLNRLEYRNTIQDLMGIDFDTSVEFPPDDSGDGFDNNADALSVSPLLAEKYIEAARQIVDLAVPKASRVVPIQQIDADEFESDVESESGDLSFDTDATAALTFNVQHDAMYRVVVPIETDVSFDFDPGRARIRLLLDDQVLHEKEYLWRPNVEETHSFERHLAEGEHTIRLELKSIGTSEPVAGHDGTYVRLELPSTRIEGPLDPAYWHRPDGYEWFFRTEPPQDDSAERFQYAADVLRRFCRRAIVDRSTKSI